MISSSPEETLNFGRELGSRLPNGSVLFLQGDLGAGKTTLVKGIAEGAAAATPNEVTSPTFALLNIYGDKVYHFDLYRLNNEEEFIAMGFDEYLDGDGICCIEWSERIPNLVENPIRITLEHLSEEERSIKVEGLS